MSSVRLSSRLLCLTWFIAKGVAAGLNINASLEMKFQVDNRILDQPSFSGESWIDSKVFSVADQLSIHLTGMNRLSQVNSENNSKLYQGYIEKVFPSSYLKLGRFQYADQIGFYLVDGLQYRYSRRAWHLDFYGGIPHRLDLVRSVSGDSVFGINFSHQGFPDWKVSNFKLKKQGLQVGWQRYRDDQDAWRLFVSWLAEGKVYSSPYFFQFYSGYRVNDDRLENIGFNFVMDLNNHLRWRSNYEFYQPNQNFITFRERFVRAYGADEQGVFRTELHYRLNPRWHYFVAGRRMTVVNKEDAHGISIGIGFSKNNFRINGVYDHFSLEKDFAHGGLVGLQTFVSSRLELHLNGAIRKETKTLYGVNWMYGAEVGGQLMVSRYMNILISFFYIANTRLRDDYVGAIRLIYYLDRFQTKSQSSQCILFCYY